MNLRETLDAFIAARAAIASEQAAFTVAHATVPPEPAITPEARAVRRDGIEAVARAGCRDCAKALVDYAVDHEAARKAVQQASDALRDKKQAVGYDKALAAAQQACRAARLAFEEASLVTGRAMMVEGQAEAAMVALLEVPEADRTDEQKAALEEARDAFNNAESLSDLAVKDRDRALFLFEEFKAELGQFAKGPGGRPL